MPRADELEHDEGEGERRRQVEDGAGELEAREEAREEAWGGAWSRQGAGRGRASLTRSIFLNIHSSSPCCLMRWYVSDIIAISRLISSTCREEL